MADASGRLLTQTGYHLQMALPERDFFHKQPENKPARDRVLFGRLRNDRIRADDAVVCRGGQRKFEVPSQQSIVLV